MGIFSRFYSSRTVRPQIAFKFKSQLRSTGKPSETLKQNPKGRESSQLHISYGDQVSSDLYETLVPISDVREKHSNNHKYARNPYLETKNQEVIYGIYPILLALQAKQRTFHNFYYKQEVLNKNEKVKEIYRLCQLYEVPSHPVNKKKLNTLAGDESVHQGICLETSPLSFGNLEDLINEDKFIEELKVKSKLWVYLHEINDPMNLGAILRSAYYLGIDKLFTSNTNSCPLTRVVSKASSGVAEIFPVYQVDNAHHFLKFLKKHDWQIIASSASSKNTIPVHKFHTNSNILLIIGNEGRGISRELESLSDTSITIPPRENCDEDMQCLNVSVATSILIYSLLAMLKMNKI